MARPSSRVQCYLCDLPRGPWAILRDDFSEAICRGCCNYEGADRIEEVISAARRLRAAHGEDGDRTESTARGAHRAGRPGRSSDPSGSVSLFKPVHLEHDVGPSHTAHGRVAAIVPRPPPAAVYASLREHPASMFERHVRQAVDLLSGCLPLEVRLSRSVHAPPPLFARVFAIHYVPRSGPGIEYELKLMTEYPLGSNIVFHSLTACVKNMINEHAESVAQRASLDRTPISDVFDELQYERVPGDWRPLADLLPEAVRSFRQLPSREMLPLGVGPCKRRASGEDLQVLGTCSKQRALPPTSPNGSHPAPVVYYPRHVHGCNVPMVVQSSSRSGVRHTTCTARTHGSMSAAQPCPTLKEQTIPISTATSPIHAQSSAIPGSTTPISVRTTPTPPRATECQAATNPASKPTTAKSNSSVLLGDTEVSSTSSNAAQMPPCFGCHHPLGFHGHFVQCPSVESHKFCFLCARSYIESQDPGKNVFCPSGMCCPVAGGSGDTAWAFMKNEIDTIFHKAEQSVAKTEATKVEVVL